MISYFDYAAATPLDPQVEAAMQPFYQQRFVNPSSLYLSAKDVRQQLENARSNIARTLGVQPPTMTFTAGVTEANNIFLQGTAWQHPKSHMIISAIEHESVHAVVELLQQRGLVEYDVAPVDEHGAVKLQELLALIRPTTTVISVIHIHNEFGVIQDLPAIAELIRSVREQRKQASNSQPLWLHSDAAQSANYLTLNLPKLGVDALSLSAAKLYGPKQVGVLYVRTGVQLSPLFAGGTQEHGLRAGTPNVAGAAGLATALTLAQASVQPEMTRLSALQQQLEQELADLPGATIHVPRAQRVPAFTSVSFDGQDGERLVMELDERGIQLGTGSACNAGSGEPSASLVALGLTSDQARSTIRISMGRHTTDQDIKHLLNSLRAILT